jgi:hypothetical protein
MAITLCRRIYLGAGDGIERGGITASMPSPCCAIVW